MRTAQEILEKLKATKETDMFGFQLSDLLGYLPFETAKPYLKDEVTEAQWKDYQKKSDHQSIILEMGEYMTFAWGKANNCRGLSAMRSLQHIEIWLWMLGEDEAASGLGEYTHYGKPQLRAVCDKYNIDWKALDNGRWTSNEMDDGVPADTVGEITLTWKN